MTPDKIGRYQIEKQLGEGGMAAVFLAHDPLMARPVAVKILPRQFTADSQFRARFEREAKISHFRQPFLLNPIAGEARIAS